MERLKLENEIDKKYYENKIAQMQLNVQKQKEENKAIKNELEEINRQFKILSLFSIIILIIMLATM